MIVARDFNIDKRPDVFAAKPPLEYLRYLMSRCASSQLRKRKTKPIMQDVKKAYFYAPATRDVYVELPSERVQPRWPLLTGRWLLRKFFRAWDL